MNDFEAAKKKAAAENKSLLVDFTGSDWCGWCIKLNKEVFQHEPFKTGVADNFILVELDYPKDKSKLTEAEIQQNAKLREVYQIQGFPTILITDAEGRPFAKTGYQKGGPESYVNHLDELLETKTARDEAFAMAKDAKGVDRAKAFGEGLNVVPAAYHDLYPDVIAEILKNDPEDKTGFKANQEFKAAERELEKGLQSAMRSRDTHRALTLIDSFVAEQKLEGLKKQQTLSTKINILMQTKDVDALEKVADEIIAVDPDSDFSKTIQGFKDTQLQKLREEQEDK